MYCLIGDAHAGTKRRKFNGAIIRRVRETRASEPAEMLRRGVLLWPGCVLAPVAPIPAGVQSGSEPKSDNPSKPKLRTVEENIEYVREKTEYFSLYCDKWEEGRRSLMQQGLHHLFENTDLKPSTTPSSNCIFVRSSTASKLQNQRGLQESCWPFHKAVIERLGVKLILCLGAKARDIVKRGRGLINRSRSNSRTTTGRGQAARSGTQQELLFSQCLTQVYRSGPPQNAIRR